MVLDGLKRSSVQVIQVCVLEDFIEVGGFSILVQSEKVKLVYVVPIDKFAMLTAKVVAPPNVERFSWFRPRA